MCGRDCIPSSCILLVTQLLSYLPPYYMFLKSYVNLIFFPQFKRLLILLTSSSFLRCLISRTLHYPYSLVLVSPLFFILHSASFIYQLSLHHSPKITFSSSFLNCLVSLPNFTPPPFFRGLRHNIYVCGRIAFPSTLFSLLPTSDGKWVFGEMSGGTEPVQPNALEKRC